jgi:hypothetical protein
MRECALRGITEEVHTFARWKQLGYKVKSGEHALFSTMLWKTTTKRVKVENTEDIDGRMYMCKSFLFGESQVEKEVSKVD